MKEEKMPETIEVAQHELNDERMDAICEAGRRALDMVRKELLASGVGDEHILAALSVSVAGALTCYEEAQPHDLIEAIEHSMNFWEVKDGEVHFRSFSSFPTSGN